MSDGQNNPHGRPPHTRPDEPPTPAEADAAFLAVRRPAIRLRLVKALPANPANRGQVDAFVDEVVRLGLPELANVLVALGKNFYAVAAGRAVLGRPIWFGAGMPAGRYAQWVRLTVSAWLLDDPL